MNWGKRIYLATYHRVTESPGELIRTQDRLTHFFEVSTHSSDIDGFKEWVSLSDSEVRFPRYAEQWLPPRQPEGTLERKLSEHWVSTELGLLSTLKSDAIIVDIAAAASPFQDVLTELGYGNVWKSDLNYSTDTSNRIIGGSGSAGFQVFNDNTVDLLVSHNSIEHFERGEDLALFRQINRILRPGGRFVWIPLGLAEGGLSETDPRVWETKYRNALLWPKFDRKYPVLVSNRKQRLMKWWDPEDLGRALKKTAPNCKAKIYGLKNSVAGNFALVLEKQSVI